MNKTVAGFETDPFGKVEDCNIGVHKPVPPFAQEETDYFSVAEQVNGYSYRLQVIAETLPSKVKEGIFHESTLSVSDSG